MKCPMGEGKVYNAEAGLAAGETQAACSSRRMPAPRG